MKLRNLSALPALGVLALAACADQAPLAPDHAAPTIAPTLQRAAGHGPDLPVLGSAVSNRTEPEHLDRGRFNISFKYVTPVTDQQRAVFEAAAERWERIIIADVPSVSGTLPSVFPGLPPVSTTVVDDIVIEVALTLIDGPGGPGGNILGSAGPVYVRSVDRLPVSGVMYFDTYDLDFLDSFGLFDEVIEHEMGHVLGIGTLWNYFRALRQGPVSDYAFVGKYANIHWQAEGGTGFLPVANVGGAGSIGGHWRESVMRNELMTPILNLGVNPLSRITAASLRDMGYGVGVVGEQYALEKGATGAADPTAAAAAVLDIASSEQLLQPIGVVAPQP